MITSGTASNSSPFLEHEHYSEREDSSFSPKPPAPTPAPHVHHPSGSLTFVAGRGDNNNPSYYEDTDGSEAGGEDVDPDENVPLVQSLKTDWGQFTGAVYNLTNSTIGSGVLALPYVMKQAGLIPGICFLFIFACLTTYSLFLLHKSSQILLQKNIPTFNRDYEDIARILHSDYGSVFVKLCIIVNNFGACISYLVIIGDLLVPALNNWFGGDLPPAWFWDDVFFTRAFLVTFVTFAFLFPLSLYSKISSLKFTSLLSLFAVLGFILVVILYFFIEPFPDDRDSSPTLIFDFSFSGFKNVIIVLPIITFCVCLSR